MHAPLEIKKQERMLMEFAIMQVAAGLREGSERIFVKLPDEGEIKRKLMAITRNKGAYVS